MENTMKCEKCGGEMKKVDEQTMVCGGCGATVKVGEAKKDETPAAGENKQM